MKLALILIALLSIGRQSSAQNVLQKPGNAHDDTVKLTSHLRVSNSVTFTDGTPLGIGALGIKDALLGSQNLFSTTADKDFKIANFNYAEQRAATTGSIQGTEGFVTVAHPQGTVNLAQGTIGNVQLNSSQALTTAISVQGGGNTSLPGRITDWKILNALINNTGKATISNAYGLYVNNFPEGVANKFGVYVADSEASNFLAGNLGIGIINPKDKLTVNGTVKANDVKFNFSFPADALSSNYNLLSLADLKKYIAQNYHLPDMQSNSSDGASLSEINKVLSKKVEELTLYLIQSDEQIRALKLQQQEQAKISQALMDQLKQIQTRLSRSRK